MHFVFIMDPPETVLPDEDTSFALMVEAVSRGHRVEHCLMSDLVLEESIPWAAVRPAATHPDRRPPLSLGEARDIRLKEADAVLIRTDPPFDRRYLWGTLMLEHLRGETLVVNDPRGLREANEKLYACRFPELMPPTLVASNAARIEAFTERVGGRAVIKPVDGAAGAGVMALFPGDPNRNAIIESATGNGRRPAVVQEYLPGVEQGDKRILLLDGEPLGAVNRVARPGELRSNIHLGGSVRRATIDPADREIIDALRPALRRDGLHFVGLDVIGGRLTEINVTSPTGIQQMSRLDGENHSARVIDWLEQHAAAV
jgi:glutathione synthase